MSWTKWRVGTACAYAGYVLVALGNAVSPQGVDRVDLHRVRAAAKRAALPARLATRLCAQGREFFARARRGTYHGGVSVAFG